MHPQIFPKLSGLSANKQIAIIQYTASARAFMPYWRADCHDCWDDKWMAVFWSRQPIALHKRMCMNHRDDTFDSQVLNKIDKKIEWQ